MELSEQSKRALEIFETNQDILSLTQFVNTLFLNLWIIHWGWDMWSE